MSPEFKEQGDKRPPGEIGHMQTDTDLVRMGVVDFFAENYESNRSLDHSERVVNILKDFGHETDGLEMAALLHDVIDHGIVTPKNPQLRQRAGELIDNL